MAIDSCSSDAPPIPCLGCDPDAGADPSRQPGGDAAGLHLETFLPYRLSVLANTISHSVALAYRDRFGLSVAEWRVMATLGDERSPDVTLCANTVAARTAMDKVQVSRAIARMVTVGLVSRQADPSDRRRAILSLTEEGRAVYDSIVPAALDYEQRLMGLLTAPERACLSRLIDKLMTCARRVDGAGPVPDDEEA